jgi:mono/diheme cytochrome c family protein
MTIRPFGSTRVCALLLGALTLCSVVSSAAGQERSPDSVSTSSGVYTSAQAQRGEQTYMSMCVSCHPSGTYTAPAFREKWNGTPLSELYAFVSSAMPQNAPGSLEPDEYAQVIAYLLKINGAPAGRSELSPDSKALRRIRISFPAKGH